MSDLQNTKLQRLLALAKQRGVFTPTTQPTAPNHQTAVQHIPLADRQSPLRLSFSQQRLCFIEQLNEKAGTAYLVFGGLRLTGSLNLSALRHALNQIVSRHEVLRSQFQENDHQWEQTIAPENCGFPLEFEDFSQHSEPEQSLDAYLADQSSTALDLINGRQLRGSLIRLSEQSHILFLCLHHAIVDGWSMSVFFREFAALYKANCLNEANPLPPLPCQFADYAHWQHQQFNDQRWQSPLDYWCQQLSDAPPLLELPTDFPRPDRQDYRGRRVQVTLDKTLTGQLNSLAQQQKMTLHTVLISAWALLLSRLSGQVDVVVGTPVANRVPKETEALIGYFVNTLPVRIHCEPSLSIGDFLKGVQKQTIAALSHQQVPLDLVVEQVNPPRSQAYSPIFQTLFTWQNTPSQALTLPNLTVTPLTMNTQQVAIKMDLAFSLMETNGEIKGELDYASALFRPETIDRFIHYWQRILCAMTINENQSIDQIELVDRSETSQLLALGTGQKNDTTPGMFHTLFESQVTANPNALALIDAQHTFSYQQLNQLANQLAHWLIHQGAEPERRIAVLMPRQANLVVAALGIFKSGAAYVPMDPNYPTARLAFMLEDSAPILIITDRQTHAALPAIFTDHRVLMIDDPQADWRQEPVDNLLPQQQNLRADHLAYIIYTSGSTGKPKGVMVEHRGYYYLAQSQKAEFIVGPGSRVLQFNSLCFDVSLLDFAMALGSGAALCLPGPDQLIGAELQRFLALQKISHATLPPAALSTLDPTLPLPDLQVLISAGDVIAASTLIPWLDQCRVYNAYGPTEATILATWFQVTDALTGQPPIGQAVPNTSIYLVDKQTRLCPTGTIGEIVIGGDAVARGYLNLPTLTKTQFVHDPFAKSPTARMYRTGDLGRWLPDGNLQFLGRNSAQIKIRGFRIEPGEIESTLYQCVGIQEAIVIVHQQADHPQLVAYLTTAHNTAIDAKTLRSTLAKTLPDYMVPRAYVLLEKMPLTPSGKVDRTKLPEPQPQHFIVQGYQAPRGDVEQVLADLWQLVLGLNQVGRNDHFFDLGGHSLLAVQLASRIHDHFHCDFTLSDVFDNPVLHEAAAVIESKPSSKPLPAISARTDKHTAPLSLTQQRLWFLSQLTTSASAAYLMTASFRIDGPLDQNVFSKALNHLYRRHQVLRTTIKTVNGQPVQIIDESNPHFPLIIADAETLETSFEPEFNLQQGPLVQSRLIRLSAKEHRFQLAIHHLIFDGWSMTILLNELATLYQAFVHQQPDPLPPLTLDYGDFSAWQRHYLTTDQLQPESDYWKTQLNDIPTCITLPTDRARPTIQTYQGAALNLGISHELTAQLKTLGKQHHCTLYMTLLASWALLLTRLSNQDEVIIGSPTAGRTRRETEPLLGMFVNTLAMRIRTGDIEGLPQLLTQTRQVVIDAQAHQNISFEQVVEAVGPTRNAAHSPLFQVLFSLQSAPDSMPTFDELTLTPIPCPIRTAQFDLSLYLTETEGRIEGTLNYATALFNKATAQRFLTCWQQLLTDMVLNPNQPIHALSLLPEAEKKQLLYEFNRTQTDLPLSVTVNSLFEAQAALQPDSPALIAADRSFTYETLNQEANQLAHWLIKKGIKPESRVAIAMERQSALVVALLAILKAGGSYIPVDPAYPTDRIDLMLEDGKPTLLIVDNQTFMERMSAYNASVNHVIHINKDNILWTNLPTTNPVVNGRLPNHLAYTIFTSGSTGRPKGVMVSHKNVVNFLLDQQQRHQITATDSLLAVTTISFDIHVLEIYLPLISGAQLHLATTPQARDGHYLHHYLSQHKIGFFQATPATWKLMLASGWQGTQGLKALIGGEAFHPDLVAQLQGRVHEVWNMYGPTETTVWSCCGKISSANTTMSIGRPIANTQVYILDRMKEPVPVGVTGELYLGGCGVSCGYLNQPTLTEERFLQNPFLDGPDARLYRTGDSARWLPDGRIEYLGRNDNQIKLRGFRIELGDVEAAIGRLESIHDCVATVKHLNGEPSTILAYYVGQPEATVVRAATAKILPDYMMPSAFIKLAQIPLTPNGKVDRQALPSPDHSDLASPVYEAPENELEILLADIWKTLLNLERVGRHDHFFSLGGHSILAVQMVNLLSIKGIKLSLATLFSWPILSDLAMKLTTGQGSSADEAIQFRRNSTQTPLFIIPESTGEMFYGPRLTETIDAEIPVYGLTGPDRYQPPKKTLAAAAKRYVEIIRRTQPHGPYRLAGWSFGGVLGYEIARQLIEQQQRISFLGMIDSQTPEQLQAGSMLKDLSAEEQLNWISAETVIRLGRQIKTADQLNALQQELTKKDWKSHFQLARKLNLLPEQWSEPYFQHWLWHFRDLTVAHYQPEPLPISIHLFVAQANQLPDPLLGWEKVLPTSKITRIPIPGEHDELMSDPFISDVGQALSKAIKAADQCC